MMSADKKPRCKHRRKIISTLCLIVIISLGFLISSLISDLVHEGQVVSDNSSKRQTQSLNRGLVAIGESNGDVYLSWRMLINDTNNSSFDIYRHNSSGLPKKLNTEPIRTTTDFLDQDQVNKTNSSYYLVPRENDVQLSPTESVPIGNSNGSNYISIPLQNSTGYFAKLGVGDLDGDGQFDFVIKIPEKSLDPSPNEWIPSPDTYKIEAYLANGSFLWQKDLGWDIEMGIWYSPFVVFDITGDGKAEVIVKRSSGDHRNEKGEVKSGPEFLAVWDGMTGEELCSTEWIPRWYQDYTYNSRNLLGIAYLDGGSPHIIMQRGTYDMMKVRTFFYQQGELKELWRWQSDYEFGTEYYGQGAHTLHSADIDDDGMDEIILGSCVIDHNGQGLWSTGFRHPDHCYVGDLDPSRPGLEIYYGIESHPTLNWGWKYGINMVDAKSGSLLWSLGEPTTHIHREGFVSDIDPSFPGMECISGERDTPERWFHSANGTLIAREDTFDLGLNPTGVYWDSDLQREIIYGPNILNYEDLNHSISTFSGGIRVWADIIGDWREEIITSVMGEIRIYISSIPAIDRRPSLMYDPIYRLDVAHISMGYPQVPTTSFCLGYPNASKTSKDYPQNYGLEIYVSLSM
jgi:rhamnogalacturonan endolyase